jgi:hypothetical protein
VNTLQLNDGPTHPIPEVLHPARCVLQSASVVAVELSAHCLVLHLAVAASQLHLIEVSVVLAAAQIDGVA